MTTEQIIPVILCGGVGSRLWPVSREMHPKPFIQLDDGQSLIQKAFLHGVDINGVDKILTVTNRDLLFKIQDEFEDINRGDVAIDFILEPFGRNTAAALISSALQLQDNYGSKSIMLVLAADHMITKKEAFQTAVSNAVSIAKTGKLVTFGVQPKIPETGFGYIEFEGNNVKRFVEKPCYEDAVKYVESGQFLWNSGMFCFTAETLINEAREHCPTLLKSVEECLAESTILKNQESFQVTLDSNRFETVEDVSIDYAIMEKSHNVAVIPCDIGWNDIGSWSAMSELTNVDINGNRIDAEVELYETTNCYIRGENNRLISAVGIDNLVIVDTDDALLIADRDQSQNVKMIFNQLKDKHHPAYQFHQTVHRPWGEYTVLEEGESFKIKRIVVKPNASLSLQMHHHRSEHWIVVNGTALVVNGDQEFLVSKNESTYIPAGYKHRLTNPGKIDLVMIEVQSGDYLEEDDIVRFDDIYGRE